MDSFQNLNVKETTACVPYKIFILIIVHGRLERETCLEIWKENEFNAILVPSE